MELLADDCAAVLHSFGVDKPAIVCGLSMGGYVAFALFRRYPSLIRGMILAATQAGADSPEAQENREMAAASVEQNGIQDVVDSMLPRLLAPQTYPDRPELVEKVKKHHGSNFLPGYGSCSEWHEGQARCNPNIGRDQGAGIDPSWCS